MTVLQMRIAILMSHDTREYKLGSEIFGENLSHELAAIGNEVHIFRGFSRRDETIDSEGVCIHNHSQVNLPFIGSNLALRKMITSIKKEETPVKFDWIIMIGGGVAIASGRLKSRNLAFFVSDVTMNEFKSVSKQLSRLSLATLKEILVYRAISIGEKRGIKYSKFVICSNQFQAEEIESLYDVNSKKVMIIPLGLPDLWYGEQTHSRASISPAFNFIYFGAGKRRNLGLFLACLKELKQEGFNVSGAVVRANEEEILEIMSLRDLNVKFYNNIDHEKLVGLYSDSLALVVPSYREGFCIPVIEAASQSVPTISSNLLQLHGSVVNDETGILIDGYELKDWVNAMRKLITNESFLSKLKIGARGMADRFRMRVIVTELDRSLREEL